MSQKTPRVLLIGFGFAQTSVKQLLGDGGCACELIGSHKEACIRLADERFDLVLTPIGLPDGSAMSFLSLLKGSSTTLFFFEPAGSGCWWLPALFEGRECYGKPALLPSEFTAALDEFLTMTGKRRTSTIQSPSPTPAALRPRDLKHRSHVA